MMDLLRYLDARMGEASTYAGVAALLGALHVSVDPGVLHAATLWGMCLAGVLAVVLREAGKVPAAQVAEDAAAALVAGVKAMPAPAAPPAAPTQPAA